MATAQQQFIKVSSETNASRFTRILATSDNGWAIVSLDSMSVTKYDQCGVSQWRKQYKVPNKASMGDAVALKNGGIAMAFIANKNLHVVKLSSNGTVAWANAYENSNFNQYSYTLLEDAQLNLICHFNVIHKNTAPIGTVFLKIAPNGNVVWGKGHGPIGVWGNAITTSDNGLLMIHSRMLVKMDGNGTIQWQVNIQGQQMTDFRGLVEVSDGYIFSGRTNPGKNIVYFKVDKSGGKAWQTGKKTNYFGQQPFGFPFQIRKKSNGNILNLLMKDVAGKWVTSIVEFDKDLNIVHQNTLVDVSKLVEFTGNDICILNGDLPVFSGVTTNQQKVVYAKLSRELKSSCDVPSPLLEFSSHAWSLKPLSINSWNYQVQKVQKSFTVENSTVTEKTICKTVIPQQLNLGRDTSFCKGEILTLKNQTPDVFESYLWSNGATIAEMTPDASGTYWLRGVYNCGTDTLYDTINVTMFEPVIPNIGADIKTCGDTTFTLDGPSCTGCSYSWSTGDNTSSIVVSQPGIYVLQLTSNEGCIATDSMQYTREICNSEFTIPNVFTPNADGINDLFQIKGWGILDLEMDIYNRWGERLFHTNMPEHGWDGRTGAGEKAADGTYFYSLKLTVIENEEQVTKVLQGTLTLMR